MRVSRRGAESQRVLLCVWFSQRLSVSAGDGFRHCVVELLFHRGVVGRDWGRMSGASFPAEAQRVWICVAISQRLSVSAGDGIRHRVVELLFHRGVGDAMGRG